MQRFTTAAEYEGARANYCEDMTEREAMVEDAITGNLLRIKDQTLHVSTATDVVDNAAIPLEWRVNDVRQTTLTRAPSTPSAYAGSGVLRRGPTSGRRFRRFCDSGGFGAGCRRLREHK